jgi:hypothetical protein
MIEEFDRLAIYVNELDNLSKEEIIQRVKMQDELLKRMSDEEINTILSRKIPVQYKIKISKIRSNMI